MQNSTGPVRVLIVDDSSLVRTALKKELDAFEGIEVVGAAPDPFAARDMIHRLSPEALVLDIEMPRMDGYTFLRKIMRFAPIPTIICSSLTPKGCDLALACLEAGAVEVFCKPGAAYSIGDLSGDLARTILNARSIRLKKRTTQQPAASKLVVHSEALLDSTRKIVALGTSTGGTEALRIVLGALPPTAPGILVVQHMPAQFTKSFAERLNSLCQMEVKHAQDGDTVVNGRVLLAPGNKHMRLRRDGARYLVELGDDDKDCQHRPSAEVLFESVARYGGSNAMAGIMTGMGSDGAVALGKVKDAGGYTLAQDENSCIVFGMPKEAIRLGNAQDVLPLNEIAQAIVDFASGKKIRKRSA